MKQLLFANIIWAFSFSFIGHYVSGKVDTYLAIFIRLFLGFLFWLPLLKITKENHQQRFRCMVIGAIQIGFMYIAYYHSFSYLKVNEVALFTITTPLYISLFSSLLNKKVNWVALAAAIIAVFGAAIIKWTSITEQFWWGFMLVQLANSCFALGQVLYRRYLAGQDKQVSFFAYFYLGALIPVTPFLVLRFKELSFHMPLTTLMTLTWLGLVASGLAYYLWNSGLGKVSTASLSVLNNVLVPLAIIINFLFWPSSIEWLPFILGSLVIVLSLFFERFFIQMLKY